MRSKCVAVLLSFMFVVGCGEGDKKPQNDPAKKEFAATEEEDEKGKDENATGKSQDQVVGKIEAEIVKDGNVKGSNHELASIVDNEFEWELRFTVDDEKLDSDWEISIADLPDGLDIDSRENGFLRITGSIDEPIQGNLEIVAENSAKNFKKEFEVSYEVLEKGVESKTPSKTKKVVGQVACIGSSIAKQITGGDNDTVDTISQIASTIFGCGPNKGLLED